MGIIDTLLFARSCHPSTCDLGRQLEVFDHPLRALEHFGFRLLVFRSCFIETYVAQPKVAVDPDLFAYLVPHNS